MTDAITYKTESRQAMFDFVIQKLWDQGGPSIDNTFEHGKSCLYRSADRKCALGWLIPDEEYTRSMEGRTLNCAGRILHKDTGKTLLEVEDKNMQFIRDIQDAHDDSAMICAGSGQGRWKGIRHKLAAMIANYDLDDGVYMQTFAKLN